MNDNRESREGFGGGITVERVLLLVIVVLQAAILWKLAGHGAKAEKPAPRAAVSDAGRQIAGGEKIGRGALNIAPRQRRASPASASMMEEMESLLDSVIGDFEAMDRFMNPPRGWGAFEPTPAMDMYESGESYTVVFIAPELDPASMKIVLEGRMLSVSALPAAGRIHSGHPRRLESRILLPGPVGPPEESEALFTNGILRVSVRKAFPAAPVAESGAVLLGPR
jgi:HSP20 family molecular chaperone IbpA